jgi:Putative peptidoglycan binding domain
MSTVIVSLGDSIPSLAKDNGFFPDTIWNHPSNAGLRAKRKSQNQLYPGDEVFIPELRKRTETRGADSSYKFHRKGVPAKLVLQLRKLGQPRKNESYVLVIDGTSYKGTLDGDGKLQQFIPPNAKSGQLILSGGKEVIPINIGYLNPIDELSGVQQRLNNLKYFCGNEDGTLDDQTKGAISAFQSKNGLQATGQIDGATKAKLLELHP